MCVCMFAYSLRRDKPICPKLGNKVADTAARDTTVQGALIPDVPSLDFKTAFRQCGKWQQDWDHMQWNKLWGVKSVVLHGGLLIAPSTLTWLWWQA
jgi:hypothetical protein